jgi:23S rRNA pseudouridine2605 synthase
MMRLQRYLSEAGVAARRKAEELITAGRVTVNGRVVDELGSKVDPDKDTVTVDGLRVQPEDKLYLVLNKPKGYVSTVSDPQGRHTVMELLPRTTVKGLRPVGRLDYYTEGVLLFTNDGELQSALLAPRSRVEKTYNVKIRGQVRPAHIEALRKGVKLDDGRRTLPAKVDLLHTTEEGQHTWLVITITEGRSRQIHRMAEALGYQIIKLSRVSFGGITYFGLKVGQARHLTDPEVRQLRELAGLPGRPQARPRTQPRPQR